MSFDHGALDEARGRLGRDLLALAAAGGLDEYAGPAITCEGGVWTAIPHRTSDWPAWAGGHHADPGPLTDIETAHEWPREES